MHPGTEAGHDAPLLAIPVNTQCARCVTSWMIGGSSHSPHISGRKSDDINQAARARSCLRAGNNLPLCAVPVFDQRLLRSRLLHGRGIPKGANCPDIAGRTGRDPV